MTGSFTGCQLLKISKWNTNNVTLLKGLFSTCISAVSLPDISYWNTKNVKDLASTFKY